MTITADVIIDVLAGADQPLTSTAVAKLLKTSQTRKVISLLTDLVREEALERTNGGKYKLRDAGSYDAPSYSTATRRTLLPTDKQAIAAGERRKAVAKLASSREDSPVSDDIPPNPLAIPQPVIETAQKPAQEVSALPNGTIPVDKSNVFGDKVVDNFAEKLETNVAKLILTDPPITTLEAIEAKVDEEKDRDQRIRDAIDRLKRKATMEVAPVDILEFKIEILDGIGSTDEDLLVLMSEIVRDLRRLDALAG